MQRHVLFLLSSARPDGNALRLARRAAAPLPVAAQVWMDLTHPPLAPFVDLRPGFAPPQGRVLQLMLAMQAATDVVFVAPVYWYALPGPAKLLLDHWSGWLDAPDTGFASWAKEKTVHLITTRGDPDPTVADLPEAMLKRSILWLGMQWGTAVHGIADAPGDIDHDTDALRFADRMFAPDVGR